MKKYLVLPGRIVSENDGDVHYISADQLIRLHGVNPSECIVAKPFMPIAYWKRTFKDLIWLTPDRRGNYGDPAYWEEK